MQVQPPPRVTHIFHFYIFYRLSMLMIPVAILYAAITISNYIFLNENILCDSLTKREILRKKKKKNSVFMRVKNNNNNNIASGN